MFGSNSSQSVGCIISIDGSFGSLNTQMEIQCKRFAFWGTFIHFVLEMNNFSVKHSFHIQKRCWVYFGQRYLCVCLYVPHIPGRHIGALPHRTLVCMHSRPLLIYSGSCAQSLSDCGVSLAALCAHSEVWSHSLSRLWRTLLDLEQPKYRSSPLVHTSSADGDVGL